MLQNKSIRSSILEMVAQMNPYDPLEQEHLDFVRDWIASGVEIFRIAKPATPNIHLVSYFSVIDQETGQYLLVDHKKAELWVSAGGHVEVNEHPKETVKREVVEELGIEADFLFEEPVFLTVAKTVGNTVPHIDVSFWYLLKGSSRTHLNYDKNEFHRIRWFDPEEIPFEKADPHLKRFIDKISEKMKVTI